MSLKEEKHRGQIPELRGATVGRVVCSNDGSGYGFVAIHFTNGQILRIKELSQTGEIGWTLDQL